MDAKEFADILRDHSARELGKLEAKLAPRIEALESGRAMKFAGPFDPSITYGPGAVTQRAGATWVAMVTTSAKPGDSGDWRRIGSDR